MDSYFKRTERGRQRASQIIPGTFLCPQRFDDRHPIESDFLRVYVVSWGVRFGDMTEPARQKLKEFAD